MTEKFYTTLEVAELLKISDRTVRNLCLSGDLEHNRIGSQIRISDTALNNYLTKSRQTAEREEHNEQGSNE